MRRIVLAAILTLAAVACQSPTSTQAKTPETDPGAPVARFQGGAVTGAELEAAIWETKKQALDQILFKKLIEAKAKAEGITPEALFEREVRSKVKLPTEAEMKALYEQQRGRPGLPPYEQLKDQIAQYLRQGQAQKAQQEFVERLRAEFKAEVLLNPPRIPVVAVGPSKGDPKAPITIVEFSDFECPFCVRAEDTVKLVLSEYKGKVRLVYRDFPLPFHPNAQKAAEAAHCAGVQEKYWEMHEKLFASQKALAVADLKGHAKALGLDQTKFDKCLDSGEMAQKVEADRKAGSEAGVTGTPAFFINGLMLSGAQPFAEFKTIIDKELARK